MDWFRKANLDLQIDRVCEALSVKQGQMACRQIWTTSFAHVPERNHGPQQTWMLRNHKLQATVETTIRKMTIVRSQNTPGSKSSAERQRLSSIIVSACIDLSPIVALASILIGLLSLFMPLAIMQVYDRLIPRRSIESLTMLVALIVLATVIEAAFRIARNHIVSWTATKLAWRTQYEILQRFMAAPVGVVESESASRNLDRIQALLAFAEWHGSPSRLVLVDLPFFALYVGLMVVVGHWLAAIPLLLFGIIVATVHLRSLKLRSINENRATEDMKTRDFLVESLNGLAAIKASAMENQMQRRFERLQETSANQSFFAIRLAEEAQALTGSLSNLTQMVTVTMGAVFVIRGDISVGALACCVMLAGRAIQPLLRCVGVWNELQSVVVGLEKAEPMLRLPQPKLAQIAEMPEGPLSVHFTNVSFRHEEGSVPLLNNISFQVPAASITAISGRDGSGKSTIADLMCGYLQHYDGNIRIGPLDPREHTSILKHHVAIVRPGAAIMRGSIIDNITMFRKGDDVELAMMASRLIGLDRDVHRLPLGYQTIISEGLSTELPAGLAQRIAIARAIARRPAVLILDEANSALDMRGDRALIEGLMRVRDFTTIVAITNRPSLAAVADQRLYLESGILRSDIRSEFSQGAPLMPKVSL